MNVDTDNTSLTGESFRLVGGKDLALQYLEKIVLGEKLYFIREFLY